MAALSHWQQSSAIYWIESSEPYRISINDLSDPDNVGYLSGEDAISGLDSPEIRESVQDIAGAHGGIQGNNFSSFRPIVIQPTVTPQTAPSVASQGDAAQKIRRASNALTQEATLWIFPGDPAVTATTRVNFMTDGNFEYDVVGNAPGYVQSTAINTYNGAQATPLPWLDGSDAQWTTRTFAVDSAHGFTGKSGNNSLRIKGTKDANTTSRTLMATTGTFFGVLVGTGVATGSGAVGGVVPGRLYSAQAKIDIADAAASGGPGARMDFDWYDSNGTYISSANSNTIAVATTGAQTLTINGAAAPANAYSLVVSIRAASTTTSDVVDIYIDSVIVEAAATAGAYFDGDSANSSWLGLQGFSRSVNRPNARYVDVRRSQRLQVAGVGMTKTHMVALTAADPRIYSGVQYRQTAAHNTNLILENKGDFDAPVAIRAYGPYSAGNLTFSVLSFLQSRVLTFSTGALAAGHSTEIHTFYRDARQDPTNFNTGGTDIWGNIDWTVVNTAVLGMQPGPTNTFKYVASGGGTTGASLLEVRWQDVWL